MCRQTYRPKNEVLRKTFAWFLEHGHTRHRNMGRASNAFCVARDSGILPKTIAPGTPAFAAAKAGLFVRCRKDAHASTAV